ncbi:MAG: hypothetical protein HC893_14500 [Chloroflexaceae bacterium]|nr:hypothetical protein [Chloroflexaceae bacterium]NJL34833.1 hypothetical protein [Chloroflexaceae bacterium]NJO06747.1 hypothetical protein [Chloroflexaceae bacterium]NJO84410.1 hypothetical protein [Blastochloris sp.]
MEEQCWIKRGFFVLHNCTNRPMLYCAACNRPSCAEHISQRRPDICVDCAARASEESSSNIGWYFSMDSSAEDPSQRMDLEAKARHAYYQQEGYAPILIGREDTYYDTYDVRSFTLTKKGGADDDDMMDDHSDLDEGFGAS